MNRNKSFSLLSQQEIDTLVKFLTEKKKGVGSDIMSQNSIDKLIRLIQTDKDRIVLNSSIAVDSLTMTFLEEIHFRDSSDELCELRCNVNPETNYLEMSIYNTVTDKTLSLIPKMFDEEDSEGWGYSITPSFFNLLAQSLALKYTQETLDLVCTVFAKVNYGSEDHKISEMYLPGSGALLECLL